MLGTITEKFQNLFSKLSSSKTLTEKNIVDAVTDVKKALLEADVNYSVVQALVERVKENAIGEKVLKSVKPKEQFIKVIHDELVKIMGSDEATLSLDGSPSVIMLCGLQGSGKTTHIAKLAHYLKKMDKKVMVAACDLQRPAAVEQLKTMATKAGVTFYGDLNRKPVEVAEQALKQAKQEQFDVLLVDTAGRLHIDQELMNELVNIKNTIHPHEVLYVANATVGQDAVSTAETFDKQVGITGSILTMLDSQARAGAAISIQQVTQKPLKFEGNGEKLEDLQLFNPTSMADRILGMGDVINLVKKVEEHIDDEESKKMEKKLLKAAITFDDYLKQMKMMKKMGSMSSLFQMMPGMSGMGDMAMSDDELKSVEAMILSMTGKERRLECEIIYSRRKRIAKGSGTSMDDVNRLIKGFKRIKQLLKRMPDLKKMGLEDIQKLAGGNNLWH